jgi:hypothetical protein
LDLATQSSVALLESALEKRFGDRQSIATYLAQLEGVKLGPKDSVARYEIEIDYLVRKCYPTADDNTRDVSLFVV